MAAALGFFLLALGVAGCGGDAPSPMPKAFLGGYKVQIAARGKTDSDELNVLQGSNQTILLNFVYGIRTPVRCVVLGATALTVLSQSIQVDHSTGPAEGTAGGTGTLTADGALMMTLDVYPPGGSSDGGAAPGSKVTYTITGTRQ